METRIIKTCPGIGDAIFLFQKLVNQSEKFHWKIGDGSPQRGHQIFQLMPQLTESIEYIPNCGYNKVKRNATHGKWHKFASQEFYLEANSHLELGIRIENFLPDLPTTFKLDYATNESDIAAANLLVRLHQSSNKYNSGKYIGVYTSAYSNARHWGGWMVDEWRALIQLINRHNPEYKFVFIGADYDLGVSQTLMEFLPKEMFINTIGQPLSVVIEILKRLDCFIGFPSGLSIINETLAAKQTIMFYPKHLEKLINAWPDPKRIENGSYKGCIFCEPKQIFDWMIQNKKL